MKLLHLDSSIQGENSASRKLSAAIVEQFRSADPATEITSHDLVAAPIDHLTLAGFGSDEAKATLAEFIAADVVVIGTGLYNFTIPSQLKAWIDRVLIAGATFRYGENGPEGLAGGKRVIVALARGGIYSEGSPFAAFEHAETFLRGAFGFIGITDIEFVIAEGLNMGEDARRDAIEAALAQAKRVVPDRIAA